MKWLSDLKMYLRFVAGLRSFLQETITLNQAEGIIRERLGHRDENFLRIVEKSIFGHSRSPYLPLLNQAQVELGDIRNMVRAKGLEDTLRALREAGVYVSFEEFKGRVPIVRDGRIIPVRAEEFDNPHLRYHFYRESGGSTGVGTRVPLDLDHMEAQAPNIMATLNGHGLLGTPTAIWLGILPDASGLINVLRNTRIGQEVEKWYSPIVARDLKPSIKNRLATLYIIAIARLTGTPIPRPELVSVDDAEIVAHWAAKALKTDGTCLISTQVSRALRVCIAAKDKGLDLSGAVINAGGEPPTPAKVRGITEAGAHFIPGYWIAEVGIVGQGCAHPVDSNDVHLFTDTVALIQHPRLVPGTQIEVDAFNFTTLLLTAPKVMLNVEMDDYGVLESRSCGCPLEAIGFTEHLREIRSFRKLTGEGLTLVGSDIIRILEEVLPARFGGTPLDYQLLEEEDEQGFTKFSLLVDPSVDIADEEAIIETILQALGQSGASADYSRAALTKTGSLRVKRTKPIWTGRGKLMPLHLDRHNSRPSTTKKETS